MSVSFFPTNNRFGKFFNACFSCAANAPGEGVEKATKATFQRLKKGASEGIDTEGLKLTAYEMATIIRQIVLPNATELNALYTVLKPLQELNQVRRADLEAVLGVIRAQGLHYGKEDLQKFFSLNETQATKLDSLHTAIEVFLDNYPGENLTLSITLETLLHDVYWISNKVSQTSDISIHQIAMRQLDRVQRRVLSQICPQVKAAKESLDAILALTRESTPEERRAAISHAIEQLINAKDDASTRSQLSISTQRKIDILVLTTLSQWEDPRSDVTDLTAIQETVREMHRIFTELYKLQQGYTHDVVEHFFEQVQIHGVPVLDRGIDRVRQGLDQGIDRVRQGLDQGIDRVKQGLFSPAHPILIDFKARLDVLFALPENSNVFARAAQVDAIRNTLALLIGTPTAWSLIPEQEKQTLITLSLLLNTPEARQQDFVANLNVLKERFRPTRLIIEAAQAQNQGVLPGLQQGLQQATNQFFGQVSTRSPQLIDQWLDQTNQRLNSTVHACTRAVKSELDALIALQESSTTPQRKERVTALKNALGRLLSTPDARSQIPDMQIPAVAHVLTILSAPNASEDAFVTDLNTLKQRVTLLNAPINAAISANRGLIQGTSEVLIKEIIDGGKHMLDSLVPHLSNAVAQQLARYLAAMLNLVYRTIKDNLESNERVNRPLLQRLAEPMQRMQNAEREGSFEEVIASLRACFTVLSENEIYFQGIRVPFKVRTNASAIPELLALLKSRSETGRSQTTTTSVTLGQVDAMAERVKMSAPALIAKNVVEYLFTRLGINMHPEQLSVEWLRVPNPNETSSPNFENLFYNNYCSYLNQVFPSDNFSNYIYRFASEALYIVLYKCTQFYISGAIEGVKADFKEWQKKDVHTKTRDLFSWLRDWLSITSGAYDSVAHTPESQIQDIFVLLQKAMKHPDRNGGLTHEKLYEVLTKTAMQSVHVNWTVKIERYFTTPIPNQPQHEYSYINTMLAPVNWLCMVTVQGIIYIPEVITNFVVQRLTGCVILSYFNPYTLIDRHIERLSDPRTSTSFAIKELLFNKLNTLNELVRTQLTKNQSDPTQANIPNFSISDEISTTVETLLEVLRKSKYPTVGRLRQYVDYHRTLQENIEESAAEFFLPQAMPAVTTTLWTAFQGLLNEQEGINTFYNILAVVADGIGKPPTTIQDTDFDVMDGAIGTLVDQFLSSMILYLLNGKLDLTNAKQQEDINAFVNTLRNLTQTFTTEIEPLLSNHNYAAAKAAHDKFVSVRMVEQNKADGNINFHAETVSHTNEISSRLRTQMTPLTQTLEALVTLQKGIDSNTTALTASTAVCIKLNEIEQVLAVPVLNEQHLNTLATHWMQFDAQLELLKRHLPSNASVNASDFQAQSLLLKQSDRHMQALHKKRLHLEFIEAQSVLLFDLKENSMLFNTSQMQQERAQLTHSINQLQDTTHRNALLSSLEAAMSAQDATAFRSAVAQFTQTRATCLGALREGIQGELAAYRRIANLIRFYCFGAENRAREDSLEKTNAQGTRGREALQHLGVLRTWQGEIQDVTLYNLIFFNHMQWVEDIIRSLAMSQAQSLVIRLRGLMDKLHMNKGFCAKLAKSYVATHDPSYLSVE